MLAPLSRSRPRSLRMASCPVACRDAEDGAVRHIGRPRQRPKAPGVQYPVSVVNGCATDGGTAVLARNLQEGRSQKGIALVSYGARVEGSQGRRPACGAEALQADPATRPTWKPRRPAAEADDGHHCCPFCAVRCDRRGRRGDRKRGQGQSRSARLSRGQRRLARRRRNERRRGAGVGRDRWMKSGDAASNAGRRGLSRARSRFRRLVFQFRQVGQQFLLVGPADEVEADHLVGPQRRLACRSTG